MEQSKAEEKKEYVGVTIVKGSRQDITYRNTIFGVNFTTMWANGCQECHDFLRPGSMFLTQDVGDIESVEWFLRLVHFPFESAPIAESLMKVTTQRAVQHLQVAYYFQNKGISSQIEEFLQEHWAHIHNENDITTAADLARIAKSVEIYQHALWLLAKWLRFGAHGNITSKSQWMKLMDERAPITMDLLVALTALHHVGFFDMFCVFCLFIFIRYCLG